MVRLREIARTATFAWSQDADAPWIATGTKSGAVDVDFSNETCLELWDLALDSKDQSQELSPAVTLPTETGFHDLAWTPAEDRKRGIIAGALDNGTLGLWDADGLVQDASTASISQEKVHSGAIKALQFNPKIPNFVATGGAKGELFISDLNHLGAPIRLGSTAARADDIDCLDWNKRVSNILVTGSSGGFVTVWDMKTKKESLTLNNSGRKAVSAIAWDPTKPTRLITAVPLEQEPVILVWDLRNSNAPERTLRGHDSGVLSLSWCPQDNDLLLSCGKDNRTILWNPQTGVPYGEYPVVTNWTFQTRWNPHNPNFFATASFDGKIQVQTIQNTNPGVSQEPVDQSQATDGEDFFSRAQNQPQASNFSLPKAPKWLEVPTSVSFGFGGRLITVGPSEPGKPRTSKISISKFEVDSTVGSATESFEKAIASGNLTELCQERISSSKSTDEQADWQVIQTLVASKPRSELVKYLGFEDSADAAADTLAKLKLKDDAEDAAPKSAAAAVNGVGTGDDNGKKTHKRFQSIFDSSADEDFLSDLAAAKGAKTNDPFHIHTESESEADRNITKHLILGQFDQALDIALREDRSSDAFMIAICGGPACISKAQEAYLAKQRSGPSYLRLLSAVTTKNLWDIVYNADLANWKEVVVSLCTFADAKEFPDLLEAIGDRLEDQASSDPSARKNASLCYLAGSKLEKVVPIWIQELSEHESAGSIHADADASSAFSLHARGLQDLIEKVTIFRSVVKFDDTELSKASDWKLEKLYSKYLEYADVVAAHGQLDVAQKYLDLLPTAYPGADIARARIAQASRKQPAVPGKAAAQSTAASTAKGRVGANVLRAQTPNQPSSYAPTSQSGPLRGPSPQLTSSYAPPTAPKNPYAPQGGLVAAAGAPVNPYAPTNQFQTQAAPAQTAPYGIPQASPIAPPPSRQYPQAAAVPPPSQSRNLASWNDVPEDFAKPTRSGRGTPSIPPVASPFGQSTAPTGITPPPVSQLGGPQRKVSPVPPPPKGVAPPPRVTSPLAGQQTPAYQPDRPSSSASASNAYAPAPVTSAPLGQTVAATIPRGTSPFAAPPSAAPPVNRYAPAPGSVASQPPSGRQGRPPVAPPPQASNVTASPPPVNPYAPSQASPLQPSRAPLSAGPPPPVQQSTAALVQNQFSAGTQVPQPQQPQQQQPPPQQKAAEHAPPPPKKHPKGDRSHIPAHAQPIYTILSGEMERVKARAPSSFQAQVKDTEKRLDILYDHLNNQDLIKPDTVEQLVELANAMQAKDFTRAQEIQMEVHRDKVDECGNWMVGVKRLVGMSRATAAA